MTRHDGWQRDDRGISLAEILVAASLLLIVVGMVMQILIPCMNAWQVDQTRAALEQGAMVSSHRLQQELWPSTPSSVTVLSANPQALSFMTCNITSATTEFDATSGQAIWRGFVVYYLDSANQVLYRKVWPNPQSTVQTPALTYTFPTTTAAALTATELRTVCTTTNGTERNVAYNVQSFNVTPPTSTLLNAGIGLSDEVMMQTLYVTRNFAAEMSN